MAGEVCLLLYKIVIIVVITYLGEKVAREPYRNTIQHVLAS